MAIAQERRAETPQTLDRAVGNVYIVHLDERPVLTYQGGTSTLRSTRPATGRKLNPTTPEVRAYKAHLRARHDALVARVGATKKLFSYTTTLNGFAAELTDAQVDALRRTSGVLSVTKDAIYRTNTSLTPRFLGLNARGGLWSKAGGVGKAGDGVIVGILDTGIWPEHPSFSDRDRNGQVSYAPIAGWYGTCQQAADFPASSCNAKLIGARFFITSSPRDKQGHGTHVGSTAAGNAAVPITGPDAALGAINGIAPRARIAAYKVLDDEGYGFTSGVVAGVDQAVEDGVDVLNASLGGDTRPPDHILQIAFMRASAAGIFVAVAGGNDGPYNAVDNVGPWVTTVGASTHLAAAGGPLPPEITQFSSRGPWYSTTASSTAALVKPDLTAPGANIVAAMGAGFARLSGTSMASPHVAGLAALLKQLHPDWTPMAIKSALMTTDYDLTGQRGSDSEVIAMQGDGHVRPDGANDPGLVFDAGLNDWRAWLCGIGSGAVDSATGCDGLRAAGYSLAPVDLNMASIAMKNLAEPQRVTRRVTNVSARSETYTASVVSLDGLEVSVSPSQFTLAPGASQSLMMTIAPGAASANPLGPRLYYSDYRNAARSGFAGARITLSGNLGHQVRLPVLAGLKPVLTAPAQVGGNYSVNFAYSGSFGVTARGLVPAHVQPGTVTVNTPQRFRVSIPAGTTHARFALFKADVVPAVSDLDLRVYSVDGVLRGSSEQYGSTEEINLTGPLAENGGEFDVEVLAYGAPGSAYSFRLYNWALGSGDVGNLTVSAPATATASTVGAVVLTSTGLAPGTRYMGSIVYGGSARLPSPTIVRIDTP